MRAKVLQQNRAYKKDISRRITIVVLFFYAALLVLGIRVFTLQIMDHHTYVALAARQHRTIQSYAPERGSIFAKDKEGGLLGLGLNQIFYRVAVSPRDIREQERVVSLLTETLSMRSEFVEKKIKKTDDPYEIIARHISDEQRKKILNEKMAGVLIEEEKGRAYPHETLASHILGFVRKEDTKEEGQYGLERFYDAYLSGKNTLFGDSAQSGILPFLAALSGRVVRPPERGADLILTIDYHVQRRSEEILKNIQEKWNAESGLVLVLEPNTGKIKALASSPTFDPNAFGKEKDFSIFLNPATEATYELGSVLKPVTMAAGLEQRIITPETTYTDTGEVRIGNHVIHNFDEQAHGIQTMTQVLEKSLNTGVVYVMRLVGQEKQYDFFKRFGLGERTGVDLPGEVSGSLVNLEHGQEVDAASASFGQGIAVTPLELASAIAVFANEGKLMKPYVVERIVDDAGNEIVHNPEFVRQVVSPETARAITQMLVSAVRSGFENKARVKGYFVAGKTGTAQIPRRDGKGYSDEVTHSFVGYAPAFNPRFLVFFQLNKPKGNRFAANTLTPAFRDLAEYILNYYEVPPDER
ncbi:MAG: cell division protein FtsI (penicillin-binding protein 3) [Parcubacteria group bacterium Gr01-1014_66]|nr:MAG: cell division protein FtsI (penicillin-binding protein 3) [Parcubacteria group bacterium Gr01-1014_66]